MPATLRGIYHNLKESKYTVSNSEIVFFFSSRFYLNKFLEEYKQHRETFLDKMERLTGETPLNMETFADVVFYQSVEKRGFRAWIKGVDIDCENLHKYALRKMTEPNTLDWHEIQKPKLEERLRTME